MSTVSDPQTLLRVTFWHLLETGVCLLFTLHQHFLSTYCVQRRCPLPRCAFPAHPTWTCSSLETKGGAHVCVHTVLSDLLGLLAGSLNKHALSTKSMQGGARPQPSEPVTEVRADVPRASVKDAS